MLIIVFVFICIVLILGGVSNYFYYKKKGHKYHKATGTIIAYREFQDTSIKGAALSMYYYPIIEYIDKNGDIQQIESEDCNIDAPMYPVGTVINLLVNPDDNTRILFDTATDKWQVPLVCASTGVIGLILIISFLILSPSKNPVHPKNSDIEIIKNDSAFEQLPQDVKDSVLSIIKNN